MVIGFAASVITDYTGLTDMIGGAAVLLFAAVLGLTVLLAGPEISHPIAVVVITTFDSDEYVHGALKAGARGFLLKGAAPEQLIQAVRVALHGDALIDPGVTTRLLASFSASSRDAVAVQPIEALTEREEGVLLAVARDARMPRSAPSFTSA